jgi:hypothetical protein
MYIKDNKTETTKQMASQLFQRKQEGKHTPEPTEISP